MLEELFDKYLPILIHLFELMGIIILTLGTFTAFINYFKGKVSKKDYKVKYEFADVMVTSLDFKLSAEILKTVIIRSKEELVILAVVFINFKDSNNKKQGRTSYPCCSVYNKNYYDLCIRKRNENSRT